MVKKNFFKKKERKEKEKHFCFFFQTFCKQRTSFDCVVQMVESRDGWRAQAAK